MIIDSFLTTNKFSSINLKHIDRTPPPLWKKMWYGYFQLEEVISLEKKLIDKSSHQIPPSTKANLSETILGEDYIEQQFFLNIVQNLQGSVKLLELGAGRGDWCLALAGIVDFNLIDHKITSYKCIGVEAEPTHFKWTKTHFEEQKLNAIAIHGAVTSKNGTCKFYSVVDPASNYGQAIKENGNIEVPCYTIDYLIKEYDLDIVDILHADIQGSEYDMLLGATTALKNQTIKYMIIGTHEIDINQKIIDFVKPYGYCPLFSICMKANLCDTPFGKAYFPVDGLLILRYCA